MNIDCEEPIVFFEKGHYQFMPFRFRRMKSHEVLLTSVTGEFIFLSSDEFSKFVGKKLALTEEIYKKLKSKSFLIDHDSAHLDVLASRYWTKKSFLREFVKLHIFVLTLRCNSSCTYCQVTRQAESANKKIYDMSEETARRSVEIMMKGPAKNITVEFQGGEPLLNFNVLREVVLYTESLNGEHHKNISFVVCTNLSVLTDEMLFFFKEHNINVSTSVDGPRDLHDYNRCRKIKSARYDVVVKNIRRAQEALGRHCVSALMTTTRESFQYPREIIDEYIKLDLGSVFVRSLNPYGYAVKTQNSIGYSPEEFFLFYRKVLDYVIELNRRGIGFAEATAAMLFRKILTPWPIGFVDLQSPTGNGFAVTVYNYDGDVYASDESRMLNEMGDARFRLGSVYEDSYETIYFGQAMQLLAATGVAECLAGCVDCAYVPYCGADPVRHYATQKDAYGNRVASEFCKKYSLIISYLFEILRNADAETENIIWSWLNDAPVDRFEIDMEKEICRLE